VAATQLMLARGAHINITPSYGEGKTPLESPPAPTGDGANWSGGL
jgi:hypothetical protein